MALTVFRIVAPALNDLAPEALGGVALGEGDAGTGDHRRVGRQHLGVGVEERQAREERVLLGHPADLDVGAPREVVGGVLLDGPLGAPGRARGEHDRASSVQPTSTPGLPVAGALELGQGLPGARGVGPLAGTPVSWTITRSRQGQVAGDERERLEVRVADHRKRDSGRLITHDRNAALVGQVDRALDAAGLLDAEPDREVLLAVGQSVETASPGARPAGDEGVGDPVGAAR